MNKKIFICGKLYDLATTNTAALVKKIQKRVDTISNDPDTNERLVGFTMQVTPQPDSNDLDIELVFKRNNLFAKCGINAPLVNDSDAQLIMGLYGRFTPPVMWDIVKPFAFSRYNVPISEFVYAYSESVKSLGATQIKGMQIETTETLLKLKILV